MNPPKHGLRQFAKVVGFNLGILFAMYLLWGAIPIGISIEPEIADRAKLASEEVGEIVEILRKKDAIYRESDSNKIYRETFWMPWTRSSYSTSVLIEPKGSAGIAFRIVGMKEDTNGWVGQEFLAFREAGAWEFENRGNPMSKY